MIVCHMLASYPLLLCVSGKQGDIICCDTCSASYHLLCLVKVPKLAWYVPSSMVLPREGRPIEDVGDHAAPSADTEETEARNEQHCDGRASSCEKNEDCLETSRTADESVAGCKIAKKEDRAAKSDSALQQHSQHAAAWAVAAPVNQAATQQHENWVCPKCHCVPFDEIKFLSFAPKKSKFNYQRWLSNTTAPTDASMAAADADEDNSNVSCKSKSAVSKSAVRKTGANSSGSIPSSASNPTSDSVAKQVSMSQLDHVSCRRALRSLCQVSMCLTC